MKCFFKCICKSKSKKVGTTIFIVKKRMDLYGYGCANNTDEKKKNLTGLHNSSTMAVAEFNRLGANAKIVEALDGNSIDRLIVENKATAVILEAVWCPPTKIAELIKLHPLVKWFVRIHSDIPFLSQEGMSIAWLNEYSKLGVIVLPNDIRTYNDLSEIYKCEYLPNYYDLTDGHYYKKQHSNFKNGIINVGCFGAIRSMKSHLRAALISIKVAKSLGVTLKFHINSERVEGDFPSKNSLKNLKNLLGENLIEHPWLTREDFLKLNAEMNITIVTSMSETFNIVAADSVSVGTPVIMSEEVPWSRTEFSPNDSIRFYYEFLYCLRNPGRYSRRQIRWIKYWNRNVGKIYKKFINKYLE